MPRFRPVLIAALAVTLLGGVTVATADTAPAGGGSTAASPSPADLDAAAAARQARLPKRLGLGVKAFPTKDGTRGWMADSGVPWDYAYQYLTGLSTTGATTNWTDAMPNGRYVVDYAQSAAANKAIPVFSYFQLDHLTGGCGDCTTRARYLDNLDSADAMKAWFADYTTLLKRLSAGTYDGVKGFGYTAVVHVEPDLSANVQQALIHPETCPGTCTAGSTTPDGVAAAVSATGIPELSGFANTYAGFNQAVLALRDTYAPNVLLGYHVSNWAGKYDVGLNNTAFDVTKVADQVAAFTAASGGAAIKGQRHYDLVVNDVLDRDAGAYDTQFDKHDTWWDADNSVLPDYARWESYLGRITSQLHLPVFVWQVPVGNQYFLTEDNSPGHTQDNKVAYLTDHPTELRDLGVYGVLFGSGNPGSTTEWDGQRDGVTNAAGTLCSSSGHSSGQVCWNHTSTVSDDDGGYLRMRGGQYYSAGALKSRLP